MPYLLEEIGSADSMVGLIVGIRALLEIPGLLSGPFLCRKFSPKMVLIFAAVLMALEHLLYSVVTNLPTVLILSVIHGVAAGLRLALGTSWGTLVAAELLAASSGLGYMINMARNFMRTDVVILGMIVIGLLGYIFTMLFGVLERKIVRGRTVL